MGARASRAEEQHFRDAQALLGDILLSDEWKWRMRETSRSERGGYLHNEIMGWAQVIGDGPSPVIKCYH